LSQWAWLGAMAVMELSFRRAAVHIFHDAGRLEDGEDLNDAMMDFFVKLGQALAPIGDLDGDRSAPVAYLGSLFFDVLRKGTVEDGYSAHKNVANWAKRKLGKSSFFSDDIGALAVPINEMLRDQDGQDEGKHWWLALLLNPGGGRRVHGKHRHDGVSLLCLDSLARAERIYQPPLRSVLGGREEGYPIYVHAFSRMGPVGIVYFKAEGDGTAGALVEPSKSWLHIQKYGKEVGRQLCNPIVQLEKDEPGGDGMPGEFEGAMEFNLGSTARCRGTYMFEYAGRGVYHPMLKLSLPPTSSDYQDHVAEFLGGYMQKEWDTMRGTEDAFDVSRIQLLLPDVPQQQNGNDCGFFILEHILRALTLSAELLQALTQASSEEVAAFPWPSQEDVAKRKVALKDALGALFAAAKNEGMGPETADIEPLLKKDPDLRAQIRACLWDNGPDGPGFPEAVENWAEKRGLVQSGAKRMRTSEPSV